MDMFFRGEAVVSQWVVATRTCEGRSLVSCSHTRKPRRGRGPHVVNDNFVEVMDFFSARVRKDPPDGVVLFTLVLRSASVTELGGGMSTISVQSLNVDTLLATSATFSSFVIEDGLAVDGLAVDGMLTTKNAIVTAQL